MRRGPLYVVLASACFVAMMAFAKAARAELSALEVVFWRAAVATPLMFFFARKKLRVRNVPMLGVRIVLGFTTVAVLMAAVHFLPVAEVSLLHKVQPIFVALLAPLVLGPSERAGRGLWLLVLFGFSGCALILAPGLGGGSYWGLLPLAGAATSAGAQVSLRVLAKTDSTPTVVFYFFFVSAILAAILIATTAGTLPRLPSDDIWIHALGVGVSAALAQTFLTRAYAIDRAAQVAAASYTGPVWALLVDLVVFSIAPTPLALVGGSLVVTAGLALVFSKPPKVPPGEP